MNDWQRLDELLERGLDFYGRQLVSEAIQCWREVLYLSPGHRLALEYLEAAGASADEEFDPTPRAAAKARRTTSQTAAAPAPAPSSPASPTNPEETPLTLESLSVLAVELIRERRLEEALALLYTAHGEAPKDQAISRSINVIKQKLTREYRAEIGNDLGQIPHLTVDEALIEELDLSEDEREVLRLVDGIVALDDVVQAAGFAPLQIYRALAQVLRRNLIVLKPPPPLEGPRTKTAPFRPTLVPPAPEQVAAPSGPKLVSLPPVADAKETKDAKDGKDGKEARETTGQIVALPLIPSPPSPGASAPAPGAPAGEKAEKAEAPKAEAKLEAKGDAPKADAKAAELPKTEPARVPTSTALPKSAAPTGPITPATKMPIPPAPMPLTPSGPTTTVSTSVTSVISANASAAVVAAAASAANSAAMAAAAAASNKQLDSDASNALAAALGTIDAQPRRPSAYAAHVAEAVRAHLQGKIARARELLVLCIQECPPDDPAAQRNLQRLKERLGVKEER